ncbi:MAG TPA: O-antigen polymerase [Longimicrobium sp.]
METLLQPARSRSFPVLLLLTLACLAGWLIARIQTHLYGTEALLAIMVGCLCLGPLFVRTLQGRFDVFEPLTIICAVYFLYFSFAPLVRISMNDFRFVERTFESLYLHGLLVISIPILATWVGYALPWGRRIGERFSSPVRLEAEGLRVLRRCGWGLSFAAVGGLALWAAVANIHWTRFLLPGIVTQVPQGGAEGPGQDIAWFFLALEWFIPAFLMLSVSGGFRSRAARWGYWLGVFVVYLSMTFRYRLLIFIISAFILGYLRRGRRPSLLLLAGGASVLFVLAGWLSLMRVYFGSYGQMGTTELSLETILVSGLADTRIFDTFMAVTYAVPRFIDYVFLDPFLYVFILPIPRALWPAKPEPEWIRSVGPILGTPGAVSAGAAVPHFGEYYMAFGWPGVIVGMIVFGVLTRALWAWFQSDPKDPARQVVYAICNIWLLQVIIRGYLAQIVKEFFFFLVPVILAMWAARRAQMRAAAAASNA